MVGGCGDDRAELLDGRPRRDVSDRDRRRLTLPTMMATASASLPPASFATGSAVVNMVRQIGIALGVALLVAVLGTSAGQVPPLSTFKHAWWLTAACPSPDRSRTGPAPPSSAVRRIRLTHPPAGRQFQLPINQR